MKIVLGLCVGLISFSSLAQVLRKEAIQTVQVSKVELIQPGSVGGTDVLVTDKGTIKFSNQAINLPATYKGPIRGIVQDKGAYAGQFGGVWVNPILKRTAKISFCANGVMGCSHRLTIDGKKINFDHYDVATRNKVGSGFQAGATKSVSVEGYYVYEKGHMPNPMVEQEVFVMTAIEYGAKEVSVDNSDRSVRIKMPGLAEDGPAPSGASRQ